MNEAELFECSCGFSWYEGQSGKHQCEPYLEARITELQSQLDIQSDIIKALEVSKDMLKSIVNHDEDACVSWHSARKRDAVIASARAYLKD